MNEGNAVSCRKTVKDYLVEWTELSAQLNTCIPFLGHTEKLVNSDLDHYWGGANPAAGIEVLQKMNELVEHWRSHSHSVVDDRSADETLGSIFEHAKKRL